MKFSSNENNDGAGMFTPANEGDSFQDGPAGGDGLSEDQLAAIDGGSFGSSSEGSKRNFVLFGALIAIVGGTLWAMRMAGNIQENTGANPQAEREVEAALKRLTSKAGAEGVTKSSAGDMFRDTKDVVKMFDNDPTRNQIPLEEVQKNPFELYGDASSKKKGSVKQVSDTEKERMLFKQKMEKELRTYTIQTILQGTPSAAIINGKVYREGDKLGSFVIDAIGAKEIRLVAKRIAFKLKMKED